MGTVLIVDDEPLVIGLLMDLVEDAGHTPLQARDGELAFALAQRHQPALIISEVMLPQMDGYELAQSIRADPTLAHTSIILISATFVPHVIYATPGIIRMTKPLEPTIIQQALASFVTADLNPPREVGSP